MSRVVLGARRGRSPHHHAGVCHWAQTRHSVLARRLTHTPWSILSWCRLARLITRDGFARREGISVRGKVAIWCSKACIYTGLGPTPQWYVLLNHLVCGVPSCLTRKSPRLRDMSTLPAIELFQTRPLGHMGSNYCVGRIASTFSAQMIKRLSANGRRPSGNRVSNAII
jgi:hypothetical protein